MLKSIIYEKYHYILNNMSADGCLRISFTFIKDHADELTELFCKDTLNRVYISCAQLNLLPFKTLYENKFGGVYHIYQSLSDESIIDALSYKHSVYDFSNGESVVDKIFKNNRVELYKHVIHKCDKIDHIMKFLKYNKNMAVKYLLDNKNDMRMLKFLVDEGYIEILIKACYKRLVSPLNKKQIIYLLDFASKNKINASYRFLEKVQEYLDDKLISLGLAKLGLFYDNQFMDYDVIKMYTSNHPTNNMISLIDKIEKYKNNDADIDKFISKIFMINNKPGAKYFIPIDKYEFNISVQYYIEQERFDDIEKLLEYGEKIIEQFSFIPYYLMIPYEVIDKSPYMIWLISHDWYDPCVTKYYDDDRTYKYSMFNYHSNNVTVMKKVFDKFGKISPYLDIDIFNDEVEEFLRLKIKQSHINRKIILNYILIDAEININRIYPRYYDIVTGIVSFNWNKCGNLLNDINFIFFS